MQQFYNINNNNFRLISKLDEPTLKRFSCEPIGTLEKKKIAFDSKIQILCSAL